MTGVNELRIRVLFDSMSTITGKSLIVAALVVPAMLLAACTAAPPEPTGGPSAYESADCPSPNIEGYPSLDIPAGTECGYLSVPENRTDPDSRTIRIFVMKLPSIAESIQTPLIMLAGGPGGAGSFEIVNWANKGLNANRDVYLLDQRGTHLADPLLDCHEYDNALNADISLPFSGAEATANDVAATQECYDRLAASGADIAAYNTTENAQDVADLRVALGIDEWNIYGVSYGTRLALTVLRDHPEGIRSVVLDSLSPPNVNIAERWWEGPATLFPGIFAACAEQPACAAAYPNLEQEFYDTVARLQTDPIVAERTDHTGAVVTVNVDGFAFMYPLIMASEHGDVGSIPQIIHETAIGNNDLIIQATMDNLTPEAFVGQGGAGLAFTIFCSESANLTTKDAYLAASQAAMPDLPVSVFEVMPKQARLFEQCPAWPVPAADDHQSEPTVSDIPVLILEGTIDAATAPGWVAEALPGLTGATRVDFPYTGHAVLGKTECSLSLMDAFLNDPTAPVDGACAADTYVEFKVG